MSTQSQGPAITSSPYRPYCLLRLGFLSCFGVESSDFTLWSGVCLRKDEILLWVFSGFLDTEGPAYSNVRSVCFPPVHPKCREGHSVTGQGRREPSGGPTCFCVLLGELRRQSCALIPGTWELQAPACGRQAHQVCTGLLKLGLVVGTHKHAKPCGELTFRLCISYLKPLHRPLSRTYASHPRTTYSVAGISVQVLQ